MKNHRYLLSIVVPVHAMQGRLQLLESWLSVLSHPEVQVLIVDDFTSSAATNELESLVLKLGNESIQLISGNFGGPGPARNAGKAASDSKWISFCDSDDYYLTSNVLRAISANSDRRSAIVGNFTVREFDSKDNSTKEWTFRKPPSNISIIRNPGLWRFIFLVDQIEDIHFPEIRMGEDQVFLAQAILRARNLYKSSEHFYVYTTGRPDSLTAQVKGADESKPAMSLLLRQAKLTVSKNDFLVLGFATKMMFSIFVFSKFKRRARKSNYGVRVAGGLGNQLFQIVHGLEADEKIDVFFFEESSYSNFESIRNIKISNFIDKEYLLAGSDFLNRVCNLQLRLSQIRVNLLNRDLLIFTNYVLGIFISFLGNWQTKTQKNGLLSSSAKSSINITSGYFQDYSIVEKFVAKHGLAPFEELTIDAVVAEYRGLASEERPLIVQVRLGDYKLEPSLGIPKIKYFLDSISEIQNELKLPKIWLFSNEPDEVIESLSNHLSTPVRVIPTTLTAGQTLQVMRLGHAYVISNSTFGWWGAYLTEQKDSIVIAPQPWFRNSQANVSLIPPHWRARCAWK